MEKFQNLIDNEAEGADGSTFFDVDPGEESDGPMTEPEDPHSYTRDFDQDNIKPDLFNPETHMTEYMVATLLQGDIDKGVPMFPIYLRGPVFRKIISTLDRIARSGHELDPDVITKVMGDVFTNFAPEICRTHEHALNLLFPMAPRLGDIVQLPTITGQSIVSKREYIDNRDGFDDNTAENMKDNDDEDIGRFMVITYECLHPTLRGKSFVSKHPFDLEVYGLTMSRDERGLEKLMHERGMIDMFSGRIINPLEHAKNIPGLTGAGSQPLMVQQRADKDSNQQYGVAPSAALLDHSKPQPLKVRPQELVAPEGQQLQIPGPGDLDGTFKPQQIAGKQQVLIGSEQSASSSESSSSPLTSTSGGQSLPGSLQTRGGTGGGELMGKPQYTLTESDPTEYLGRDQKHYYQNLVLTGDKAAFMYRQLIQELTHGKSKFDQPRPGQTGGRSEGPDGLREQVRGKVSIDDIRNHGAVNARQGSKGAMYGPDAFANFEDNFGEDVIDIGGNNMHKNMTLSSSATTPNQVMSIKQQQILDKDIEMGLDETVAASSGSSKYYKQYQEMKKLQREQMIENIKNQETKTYGELHREKEKEKNRIEQLKDKFNALIQFHVENGKTLEEAQVLADNQFDPETGEIDLEAKIGDNDANLDDIDPSKLPEALQSDAHKKHQSEPDTAHLQVDAHAVYSNLAPHYKKKYKHIIIKDGPGAGLPDPLGIDFGEDLFEIYPQANIALMDFLSDQWTLMVKEKQEQAQIDADRTIQKEDAKREKLKRQKEYIQTHPNVKIDNNQQLVDEHGTLVELSDDLDEHIAARNRFVDETNEHNTNQMTVPKDIEATRYRLLAAVAAAGQHAFTADYVSALFDRVGRYEKDSAKEKAERYIPMKAVQDDSGGGGGVELEFTTKTGSSNTADTADLAQTGARATKPKKRNIESEPDFQYLVSQQEFKRKQRERLEAIERGDVIDDTQNGNLEDIVHDAEVIPDYVPPTTDTNVSITPEGYVKHGNRLLTQLEYAEQIFGKKPIPIEKSNMVPSKMKQMINDHYQYRERLETKKNVASVTDRLTGQNSSPTGQAKRRFSTTSSRQRVQNNGLAIQNVSQKFELLQTSPQLQQTIRKYSTTAPTIPTLNHSTHQQPSTQSTGVYILANRNRIFTSIPDQQIKF